MKWDYAKPKNIDLTDWTNILTKHANWSETTAILPKISCLTKRIILPGTKCMRGTLYGPKNDIYNEWCTMQEFVLWSLTRK